MLTKWSLSVPGLSKSSAAAVRTMASAAAAQLSGQLPPATAVQAAAASCDPAVGCTTARAKELLQAVDEEGEAFLKSNKWDEAHMPMYMDYQATTPVDPRVVEAMLPCLKEHYGNAHSRTHAFGWKAESMAEDARKHVANLIGAQPREIIFTSGATEANNLALKGIAEFYGKAGKKHLITVQTEHKCVLATAQYLQNVHGWDVTYLPVMKNGLVDVKELEAAIRPDTALISVMMVNNEIGVIQPIKKITEIARKHGVFVHSDAAQAVGKIPVDVNQLGVDLMSISAHKMYGPKGIGALYVRAKPRRVRLVPQIHGGGQERGLRSGTLAVPLVVGMGEAARLLKEEMPQDLARITELSRRFQERITSQLEGVTLNGDEHARYPGNCNLSFDCVEGESLIMAMKDVAVSSGSACTSASLEPSYVLRAIGVDEELAHTSLRFGIGKTTTRQDVDQVADRVVEAVEKLRSLSPLWEMKQSGVTEGMVWT